MGKAVDLGKKGARTDAQQRVRQLIKDGKLKKKCCQSKPRCKRCPVRALKKAQGK